MTASFRGVVALGRSFDGLSLKERQALAGAWIASQLYSPDTLPLRLIEAAGESATECILELQRRGLDPTQFHYELVPEQATF